MFDKPNRPWETMGGSFRNQWGQTRLILTKLGSQVGWAGFFAHRLLQKPTLSLFRPQNTPGSKKGVTKKGVRHVYK